MNHKFSAAVIICLLASLSGAPSARPCAQALARGEFARVNTERAVIVWDPVHKHEDFIREADFSTNARNLGFLVPTPTPPVLSQNTDEAFFGLEEYAEPKKITVPRNKIRVASLLWMMATATTAGSKLTTGRTARVQVLNTQFGDSYQATVLKATDASALADWLRVHGYSSRPALAEWLRPYIDRHWAITAFKVAPLQGHGVSTSAVCMSFQTDRPFFPYREPADQRVAASAVSRSLRLLVLAPVRMEGQIGSGETPWPGRLTYANRLPGTSHAEIANHFYFQERELPATLTLSAFDDKSSPRPGVDDLFFTPSQNQASLIPPPISENVDHNIFIPLELLLPVAFLLWRSLGRIRQIPHRKRA